MSKLNHVEVAQTYALLCKINPHFTPAVMPDVEAFLYHLDCISNSDGMRGEYANLTTIFGYVLTPYLYDGNPEDVRYKLSIDPALLAEFFSNPA